MAISAIAVLAAASALLASGSRFANADAPDVTFTPAETASATEPRTVTQGAVAGHFIDADNLPPSIGAPSRLGVSTNSNVPPCGDPSVYTATIDYGDGTPAEAADVVCDESTVGQYAVKIKTAHAFTDSGTFHVKVTIVDGTGDAAETTTAETVVVTIFDAALSSGSANAARGSEGASVNLTATFNDANQAFSDNEGVDPGLTATVDWGDGTTSAAKVEWNDSADTNVVVTASHIYDANTPATKAYAGKVTLKDDGISEGPTQASDSFTATISDAALSGSGKNVTMTGAQAATATVASFTDAAGAQAAAADFAASIKWGDGATSNGTVTKTGSGAFDVSGTHTYTIAGTMSLTITVTDEEGQSLSMSATVTVPALPTTGHPLSPVSPISPIAAWLGLLLAAAGLAAIAIGVRRARLG